MKKDFFDEKYKLDNKLWELEKRQLSQRRFQTVLKIYSILGIVVAIFGIAYFILISFNIQLTIHQQQLIVISGVGLALSITSWMWLKIRREQSKDEIEKFIAMQDLSELLWKWAKFEEVSKQILKNNRVEFNYYSIREIIDLLFKEGKIDRFDVLALEEVIQARNRAVHGGRMLPRDMISKYLKRIEEIMNKIIEDNC